MAVSDLDACLFGETGARLIQVVNKTTIDPMGGEPPALWADSLNMTVCPVAIPGATVPGRHT